MTLHRLPAQSEKPDYLVILLHGVGASGANLFPLAASISAVLPGAEIIAPNGPEGFNNVDGAYQWFSIAGVTESNRKQRVLAALPTLEKLITTECARVGLPPEKVILLGFSQGTIMALEYVASNKPVCAVIGLSGRLSEQPETLENWPPIYLIHGSIDAVILASAAIDSAEWLGIAGAEAKLTLIDGLGHSIDHRVIELLQSHLAAI